MGTKAVIEACKEAGVQVRIEKFVKHASCSCEFVTSEP